MFVDKPSGTFKTWPIYVVTLGSCVIFLSFTLMAFHISTEDAAPASPEAGPRISRLLPSWRVIVRPVAPVGPASVNAAAARPASTVPVIISRAPDDGKTGTALPEDLALVDVDEWASSVRWSPDR